MTKTPKIIVAAPPEYISRAKRSGCMTAQMSYRIGRGFRLYRLHRTPDTDGGLMVLDTSDYKGGGPTRSLIDDTMSECMRRDFCGIVIDSGARPNSPSQLSLSKMLSKAAMENGLLYFVPESLAETGENAIVRVSTALSGGTLSRHISDAAVKYGAGRVALEIQRVLMDFTLPALNGMGKNLSPAEFSALKERHNASSFFSPHLAVNYFTYCDKKTAHFVLHDNAPSIRQKLLIGMHSGIEYSFLFYPQIADIHDSLFSGEK